ncbi:ABC transporter permease, partial [Cutibacterium avidum]
MRKTWRNPLFWVMMVILTVIFLGPLVVMILTPLKTSIEAKQVPATFFPHTWTLRSYRTLLFVEDASSVRRGVLNSLVAATVNSV